MSKVIDWSDIDTKPREVSWSDVAPASQPYGGKSLEQRQAESKAAFDAAQVPWYSRYFNGAGVDKAKEMAGQVIAGIPQAISGIPASIIAAKDAVNGALTGNLAPAERMATAITNPVMTPLKQAIELVKPGLVNAPSSDAPETAQAAQGAGALLGGAMIGELLGGPAERPIAPLENADPTLLKLEANRLRELANKPLISSIADIKNPVKISDIIDRWQAPAKIADLERRAAAIDSRYPAVQGNMTLGPESFAPAEQAPPIQGPSFPPPKEPILGPVGAVRPETPQFIQQQLERMRAAETPQEAFDRMRAQQNAPDVSPQESAAIPPVNPNPANYRLSRTLPEVGSTIDFIRYGNPVENSTNWITSEKLPGMSVYELKDGVATQAVREAQPENAYIGKGRVVGIGPDDEPLVKFEKSNLRKATPGETDIADLGIPRPAWDAIRKSYPDLTSNQIRDVYFQNTAGSGKLGVIRPEAPAITPEKLNVWDQIRGRFGEPPPAAPDAASVNKWMGIRPEEVARGANPGQRILDENLLGATKDATKANVDSALTSAGKELESKLASATIKGTKIDAQTPVYDAWAKAQKPIGSPKDSAFQSNIQGVVDDIESRYPNLNKLTPTETHSLKVELGDSIDWKNSDNPVNQMMKQIYRDLNTSIKDNVEGIGDIQKRWGDLYISSKGLAKGMSKNTVGLGTGSQPGPAVVK